MHQSLLLLGLLAGCTALMSVHGLPTVGLQLVGYSEPDAISSTVDQIAFDDKHKVAYLAGGSQLSALDASEDAVPDLSSSSSSSSLAAALPLLAQQQLPAAASDVAVCGGLVAVAAESVRGNVAPGQVLLYKAHNKTAAAASDSTEEGSAFTLVANITVGALPGALAFTQDCQTLLVTNRGEADCAGKGQNDCTDPEGSVSVVIIRYCPNPKDTAACGESTLKYKVLTAGFKAWNDKREVLLKARLKIAAAGSKLTVSQELTPELITFSEDESIAFVTLKKSSAIAVLHVASARITGIFPLGSQQQNKQSSIKALAPADTQALVPEAIQSFNDKRTDYLITVSGGSFSVLRADYEPAAEAAKTTPKPEVRMPGSPRKGLEQRVAKLTAVFDSGVQLDSIVTSIAKDAGVADLTNSDSTAAAAHAGVAVGDCPGGTSDAAAATVRRCAFVTVKHIPAVFVYDISVPKVPLFQSLALPPKMSAEDASTPFVAQTSIAYAKYSQGNSSVPLVLVGYAGQQLGKHGLGMYRVQG